MKHSVRSYALANNKTIEQVFDEAYSCKYKKRIDCRMIDSDLERYKNFRAVPPYVFEFLADKTYTSLIMNTPYYASMS